MPLFRLLITISLLLSLFSLEQTDGILICNSTTSILCQDNLSSNHSICIARSSVCDGISDCEHAIDEQCRETNPMFTCSIDEYSCPITHRCIPHQWRCNGRNDCHDIYASDELNCSSTHPLCNSDEFTCQFTHQCVPTDAKCDGIFDCVDRSDESSLLCRSGNVSRRECSNDEYPCQSSQLCIPRSNQCDTISQCHDQTDELSCSCPLDDYQREKYFFFCSRTNQCLPKDLSCEQKYLCQSDLSILTDDLCSVEHCPFGYRINTTTGQCEDINECDETVRCDQFCFNTNGSYQCSCEYGYRLKSDKHTCILRTNENELISMFGLMNDGIYRWTMIDPFVNEKTLIISINNTYLIDYDPVENFLYFVQCARSLQSTLQICSKTKGIFRIRLTNEIQSDRQMIIDGDVYSSIHSMTIDWLHGNIYFVNIDFHTIHICRVDGRFCRVLFQPSIVDYQPLQLIIDPEKGFLFFTSVLKSRTHSIFRLTLDGKQLRTFLTMKIDESNALQPLLTIDRINHHLYFYNGNDRIFILNHNGKILHVQYQSDERFHSMKIFNDKIYRTFPKFDRRSISEFQINAKYSLTSLPFSTNDESFHQIYFEQYFFYLVDFLFIHRTTNYTRNHQCEQFYLPDSSDQIKKICSCTDDSRLINDGFACQSICSKEFFFCQSSKQCLPRDQSCNEINENQHRRNCSEIEFLCDGECLSIEHRCDQQSFCYDGADEGEQCRNITCPKDYFKCLPSGKCISFDQICDRVEDCPVNDRIDGIAMDETLQACNGIGQNQQSTSEQITCESNDFFRCKTIEKCFNRSYVCDGHNDCEDSSDEEHCSNRDQEIYLSFSLHQDYTCMYGYRCVYERSESLDQLSLCISLNQLCDGIQQCPLGDDEHPRRCQNNCSDCETKSATCESMNSMSVCRCKTGFVQLINGTCVEEKSMLSSTSTLRRCTHFFANQSTCQCDLGYSMKIQSCVAMTNVTYTMMFYPRASLYFNQSGSIFAPVHSSHQVIDALLIPADDQWYLFYTEQRNKHAYLWRQKFDFNSTNRTENHPKPIWSSSVYYYNMFTVDWIHRLIYLHYTDPTSSLNGIEILYSPTSDYQSLIFITRMTFSNTKTISSISVHPFQGYLYISAYYDAQHSFIYRSFLDGSNLEVLLTVHSPILRLTIDYRHPTFYLLLSNGDIESYRMTNRSIWKTTLHQFRHVRPYSIELYDDFLIVMVFNHTDSTYDEIWLDKFDRNMTIQNRKLKTAMLIRYTHSLTYPTVKNSNLIESKCSNQSCPLDEICLLTPVSSSLCIKSGQLLSCGSSCHHRGICSNGQCICSNRSYGGKTCQLCRLSENFHVGCFNDINDSQDSCLCYLSRSKIRQTPYLCTTVKIGRGEMEIPCDRILSPMSRDQCLPTAFNETTCEGSQFSLIYHVQSQTCICRETQNRKSPCLNNGLLIIDEKSKSNNCSCSSTFYGSQCQLDACSNHCRNNASCYLNGTNTVCRCQTGFTGDRCEENICQSIRCENNGKCFVENDKPTCFCPSHFTGHFCEHQSSYPWQLRLFIFFIVVALSVVVYRSLRFCFKRLQLKSLFSHHHLHEQIDFDLSSSRIIYTHVPNQDQDLLENQFSHENDGFLSHDLVEDDQPILPIQIFRNKR